MLSRALTAGRDTRPAGVRSLASACAPPSLRRRIRVGRNGSLACAVILESPVSRKVFL